MQWIVCLLHQNELPFRHLFEKIDGKAVGPETFTGPVGKLISGKDGLILKPLEESISFEPVSGKVPIIDYELENNDLKYLYKICHLIQKGPKEGDLSILLEKPGKVCLSRWVTLTSNICRCFCQTPKPICNYTRKDTRRTKADIRYRKLLRLVKIILNLYAPMCFLIRKDYHVANGSKLLFQQLCFAREVLKVSEMEVFKEVFKNNCFFAHCENVLLAMMFDNTIGMRLNALEMILEARNRSKKGKSKKVRKFKLPKKFLNYEAGHYSDLIKWSEMKPCEITEPPLLRKYSDEELKGIAEGTLKVEKSKIPCHAQSVERMVATTSIAASNEIGYSKRHANILNKEKSYQKFSSRFKKSDFGTK